MNGTRAFYIAQILKISFLGLIVVSLVFTLNKFKLSHYFPIKTVRVYGANRIDHKEVQELILPLVSKGFFTVNVEHIRNHLVNMPWVAHISVRRVWPDRVDVKITEKNVVAVWNEVALLSDAGELFTPKKETYPKDLPKLTGPDGRHIIMLKYFNKMNRLLMPMHVTISNLEMTPFLTWKLVLNNGITLQIGHKDILTRLVHFVKVYPKIVGKRALDVDYVDLRYPNGMAVRWRSAQFSYVDKAKAGSA